MRRCVDGDGGVHPLQGVAVVSQPPGGKKSIQRRVAALVKKPETAKTALFAVIALVALSLVFVFAGRKNTAALDE